MTRILAIGLLVLMLLVLITAALMAVPVKSEEAPIKSDWMFLSDFPTTPFALGALRVDVDLDEACTDEEPYVLIKHDRSPDTLKKIVLTDGYHIFDAAFTYEDGWLRVTFHRYELLKLDGTKGLWLLFMEVM